MTSALTAENGVRSAGLAAILQDRIVKGKLGIGVSLPSERELMVEYSVSRATVREALRVLGARGLIEVRRGRRGGSYVRAPSGDNVRQSLDLFIQGHDVRFADLLDIREAIEPIAAARAALRRTPEDIEAIYLILHRSDNALNDIRIFSELNLEWHMAIVRASRNPLFLSLMTSISSALYSATKRDEFDFETRSTVARAHRRISDAILARDADAAYRRMLRHITAYAEQLDPDSSRDPQSSEGRREA